MFYDENFMRGVEFMKKILSIVMCEILLICLTGCGSKEMSDGSTDDENNVSENNASEKSNVVDEVGDLTLELDSALPFSEGLATVEKDDKWGFIDTEILKEML